MKIKIFSAYYGNMPKIIENDIIVPIQGGASLQDNDLIKLKDSVSPEISKKNDMYNEFTVLYAIWKYYSKDLDYVGLCHYRRYFVLKKYKIIFEVIKRITKRPLFHIFFVNRTTLKLVKILKKKELIIPKLKKIDMSMKEYYEEKHIKKHYEIFENVIREEFKFLEKYLDFTSRRKAGYFLNMFISLISRSFIKSTRQTLCLQHIDKCLRIHLSYFFQDHIHLITFHHRVNHILSLLEKKTFSFE